MEEFDCTSSQRVFNFLKFLKKHDVFEPLGDRRYLADFQFNNNERLASKDVKA